MKQLFLIICLSLLLFSIQPVQADEIEEDYLDIASSYCVAGEYQKAIEYLNKILVVNPDNNKVKDLKKGLFHIITGDKRSYVDSVNPHIKQAQEYKKYGNTKGEYASLVNGTGSENSYLAYYYLGNFFRDRKDYMKAIDAYNSSLSARSDFAQVYLASAITLFEAGKYEAVLNPVEKYLTFIQDDDLAYAIKSRAEFQLGMFEEAKSDNEKALSINNCPEYQFDKAKLLYKLGDYKGAKDIFTKLSANIQTSKIYEYISYCDYALGDYMSALMNVDKAFILSDDDEFLNNKYNEIKEKLEREQNGQTENE